VDTRFVDDGQDLYVRLAKSELGMAESFALFQDSLMT